MTQNPLPITEQVAVTPMLDILHQYFNFNEIPEILLKLPLFQSYLGRSLIALMTTKSSLNNIKQHDSSLIIATHNIQGMNVNIKFQQWIEFCNTNNLDIISITETKLSDNSWHNTSLSNSAYLFYTSNNNLSSSICINNLV